MYFMRLFELIITVGFTCYSNPDVSNVFYTAYKISSIYAVLVILEFSVKIVARYVENVEGKCWGFNTS